MLFRSVFADGATLIPGLIHSLGEGFAFFQGTILGHRVFLLGGQRTRRLSVGRGRTWEGFREVFIRVIIFVVVLVVFVALLIFVVLFDVTVLTFLRVLTFL